MKFSGRTALFKTKSGETIKLYSIKTAAELSGKCEQSLRNWEKSRVIPKTPFRVNGDRMYSEEQINILSDNIKKFSVKPGKVSLNMFSNAMYEEWGRYFNTIL